MICSVTGCAKTTREGKLYCPDHVERQPYVQKILDQLADRESELTAVRRSGSWRSVDLTGIVVGDLMERLTNHGPRTVERIRRECLAGEDEAVAYAYAEAMRRAGLVTTGRTTRGSTTLAMCVP